VLYDHVTKLLSGSSHLYFNVFFKVFLKGYSYIDFIILFVNILSLGKFVYNYNYVIIKVIR
jgi:hypothetical protein